MRAIVLFSSLMICACSSRTHTLTYQDKMRAAKTGFAAGDLNHDGVISRREWAVSAERAAADIPQTNRQQYVSDIDRQFLKLDKNGDGNITFEEYIADNFGEDDYGDYGDSALNSQAKS